MNSKLLASLLAISGFTLALNSPAAANLKQSRLNFSCEMDAGEPSTVVAHPEQGNVPIIRWTSDFGASAGYDQQKRCNEVTARFQTYHDQGKLRYLTTGRMNRQRVICVTDSPEGSCQGLLYTVKPGDNPNERLRSLINRRQSAGAPVLSETGARVYIEFEQFVEAKATENSQATTPETPEPEAEQPEPAPDNAPGSLF
jgi:hypothetical protein